MNTLTLRIGRYFLLALALVLPRAAAAGGSAYAFNPVEDTTAPQINCPEDMTEEAESSSGASVWFDVTASDDVDPAPAIVCTPESGSTFPIGNTTVSCTATDNSGNESTCEFVVTVEDTTDPVITCPGDIAAEVENSSGAFVTFSVSATDDVDPSPSISWTPNNGGTFPIGDTTVWVTATDASGNESSCSFTVTVQDTMPPQINCPENFTAEATGSSGATVFFTVTATDPGDESPVIVCSPASGSTFPRGDTSVFCTARDEFGNQSNCSFTVTVQDTTPPELECPSSITREGQSQNGAYVDFEVEAWDDVDGRSTVTCSPEPGSLFPNGQTTVTCTATDDSGNQSTCDFLVSVVDTTPPDITCPGDITVEAEDSSGALVVFTVTATDLVDPAPSVNCSHPSGSTFPIGITTVRCTANDYWDNQAGCSFTVTVRDTIAPQITCPDDVTAEATSDDGAVVDFEVTASDTVDGNLTISCSPDSGSTFPIGDTTVTCTATDDAGNDSTCSFTVTVEDSAPPEISCPGDIRKEATSSAGVVVEFQVTASDDVDQSPTVTCSPASGSTFPIGNTTVSCTATDDAGNQDTCSFTVSVNDRTPPTVTCQASRTLLWPASNGMIDVGLAASATDAGDPSPSRTVTVYSDEPNGTGTYSPDATLTGALLKARAERNISADGRVYLIVIRATDASGNTAVQCCTVVVPINTTAAMLSSVQAQAAAAASYCRANGGAAPSGYSTILATSNLP